MTTVLLVDDQDLVRVGLRKILDGEADIDVLRLLARGFTNHEIARRLSVSEATAKTHVARLLHKLGLRDRIHATIYAYEHDLIRPGQP
jgi:DNA-binding NarL/FixJ family response regulator